MSKKQLPPQNRLIALRFKETRLENNLTLQQMADTLKIELPLMKAIDQLRSTPQPEVITRLCRKFDKTPNWVFAYGHKG